MNDLEISVVEKTKSTYHAHLLNTDTHNEFNLYFDLAELQERQYIMDGIRRGECDLEFVARLKNYGNRLYNLLFSGEIGNEFKKLRRDGFCLRLHLPPALETLPWEYLADEEEFLFKGRENFLIRIPSLEKKEISIQRIAPPVKVLIIISNPPDLPEKMKLDVVREKRLIKEALRSLMDEGRLEVKWEDEASLERIQDALLDFKPHIIHYTGHGDFDEEKGGVLLLEDGRDRSLNMSGSKLAELLARRDVRLIVLSGCQTAIAKTKEPFSSASGALVRKGIPSVIAVQESIRDDSAKTFASRFYKALASDQPVDVALGEARLSMAQRVTGENKSFVDWGIPVLISLAHDLNMFNLDAATPRPQPPAPKGFSKISLPNPGDIFVGRQKEQRQIARALRGGDARCIMIMGPGGIGKSSLAARAVEQSEEFFHAVLTILCKSAPTIEQILLEINTFLVLNGNNMFSQVMQMQMQMQPPLETEQKIKQKIEYLPHALNVSRYLIIFDNFEEMLDLTKEPHVVKDRMVRYLLEILTTNLRESKVIITSRQDFDFTTDRRYQANILPLWLRELTQMEAFRLMENISSLSNTTDSEKLLIYEKVGGNPYILDLVAADAKDVPVGNVLADIEKLRKEFVERTLLSRLYEWLPDDETRKFFRKVSVYRMPVNQDFLVAVGGSDERIGYLLHKSFISRIPGDMYEMHTNTRAFGFERLKEIDGTSGLRETQITAAEMYYNAGKESGNVEYYLESRWFYHAAEEYNKAGDIVIFLAEPLHRWGYIELIRELLEKTVESTEGEMKASALHNLGNVHYFQGRYEEAIKMYKESMKISEELGDRSMIAKTLHQIGMIHQDQGRYEEAIKMYKESMRIKEELGDRSGIAKTLGQMGKILYIQKNYKEALRSFLLAFVIFDELNSPYRDLAAQDIMKLKQEIGEELFNKYYKELENEQRDESSS